MTRPRTTMRRKFHQTEVEQRVAVEVIEEWKFPGMALCSVINRMRTAAIGHGGNYPYLPGLELEHVAIFTTRVSYDEKLRAVLFRVSVEN